MISLSTMPGVPLAVCRNVFGRACFLVRVAVGFGGSPRGWVRYPDANPSSLRIVTRSQL
jgi:hypothetical protein